MYQALAGVSYMHQNGYMHRDIKPENFLISNTRPSLLSINKTSSQESIGASNEQVGSMTSIPFGSTSSSFDNCTLKLADFGLAKDYKKSRGNHTEYVSTRWYRAPELVLRQQNYSEKIDIFALGCIMGELFLGRPIFPGTSESDQLTRIVTVLGAPTR